MEFKDFCEKFHSSLDPKLRDQWSKKRIVNELDTRRYPLWNGYANKKMIGNLSFDPADVGPNAKPIIVIDGKAINVILPKTV